jgi:hypothetical protein
VRGIAGYKFDRGFPRLRTWQFCPEDTALFRTVYQFKEGKFVVDDAPDPIASNHHHAYSI